MLRIFLFAQGAVEPIHFWGKVVDQDGQPVVGANVEYQASGALGMPGSGIHTVRTDGRGVFNVEATGAAIQVGPIEAAGYEIVTMNRPYDFDSVRTATQPRLWRDYTAKAPAIFPAYRWPQGAWPRDKLHHDAGYWLPNGPSRSLDLLDPVVPVTDRPGEGQIQVTLTQPPEAAAAVDRTGMPFTVTLKMSKGDGFAEPDPQDIWMRQAPAAGYQPVVQLQGVTAKWNPGKVRRTWFISMKSPVGDRRIYGRLSVEFISLPGRSNPSESMLLFAWVLNEASQRYFLGYNGEP